MNQQETGINNYGLPAEMAMQQLQLYIEATEKNAALRDEKNFGKREEAIDCFGFEVIGKIEELLSKTPQAEELGLLKYRAEKLKYELEEIDSNLFQKLRAGIRAVKYTGAGFKNMVNEYINFDGYTKEYQEGPCYDNLDIFINGLLFTKAMPHPVKDLEPEMVYYQKTPARTVFNLAEKFHFSNEDVFFDVGSGLGQAAILINLLTGVRATGVEFEPAYCGYADERARALNLQNVTFINVDARKADYSAGTIFFMFTPFKGDMLQEVLGILRNGSMQRKIKIITYGPCTAEVAVQGWLYYEAPEDDNMYKLAVFSSF